jgi:hypothetical protein
MIPIKSNAPPAAAAPVPPPARPKPPRRFFKSPDEVLSQPIIPASDLRALGINLCNTQRKRIEEKGLFPLRRTLPGCERKVFYRREDVIAYLEIVNDPRWSGTEADYRARMAGRLNGGRNAA